MHFHLVKRFYPWGEPIDIYDRGYKIEGFRTLLKFRVFVFVKITQFDAQ